MLLLEGGQLLGDVLQRLVPADLFKGLLAVHFLSEERLAEAVRIGIGTYSITIDGKIIAENIPAAMAVKSAERISFRTGAYRNSPNRQTPNETNNPPLKGADEKQNLSSYLIDDVFVSSINK